MLRIAIVGTGAIAEAHLTSYLKFNDRCRVTTFVDLYPEKAQKLADKYSLEVQVHSDFQALIGDGELDAVSICLPPFAHAQTAVDFLQAGKHVLVEKPMATSLQECDLMLAAARESGRHLSVVAQNRFKTPMQKLKKVLESGLAGPILHAQVDSFWWRGGNYYDLWWRGTWEKEGGGCTMNHAVHHIDLFQWMAGMPVEVQAMLTNASHENSEVEDLSMALLRFANGGLGLITASLVHHGEEQQMVFQGEKAMVGVPWRVRASRQQENGFPDDHTEQAVEIDSYYHSLPEVAHVGHDGQIENFLAAIEGQAALLVDGNEGRKTLELVSAIYQSGYTKQAVSLPMGPHDPFYTRQGILSNARHFNEKTRNVENFIENRITLGSAYGKPKA